MTQINLFGAPVLLEDTPTNRENLRRLLAHWRAYHDIGPSAPKDLQDWARETHHRLIDTTSKRKRA